MTGQPDFAHIVIDYAPDLSIVESKSLKLYMGSFRNHAAFHEDCTVGILKRIEAAIQPKWIGSGGYWYPRGGIPIDVFYQAGKLPTGLWVPDQGVAPYRGPRMSKTDLQRHIRERTLEAGFDVVGFASPEIEREAGERLMSFLKQGYHGDMGWLAAKADRRVSPRALWPG